MLVRQFLSESVLSSYGSVQYSHELYKSQVRKKTKELAKIYLKVYHETNTHMYSISKSIILDVALAKCQQATIQNKY